MYDGHWSMVQSAKQKQKQNIKDCTVTCTL